MDPREVYWMVRIRAVRRVAFMGVCSWGEERGVG